MSKKHEEVEDVGPVPIVRVSLTPTPALRKQGGGGANSPQQSASAKAATAMRSLQRSPAAAAAGASGNAASSAVATADGAGSPMTAEERAASVQAAVQLLKYEILRVQSKIDHHRTFGGGGGNGSIKSAAASTRPSASPSASRIGVPSSSSSPSAPAPAAAVGHGAEMHALEQRILRVCDKQRRFEELKAEWAAAQLLQLQQQQQQRAQLARVASGSSLSRDGSFSASPSGTFRAASGTVGSQQQHQQQPPVDPSGEILSELTLLLWQKIEELQRATGTFVAAKERLAGAQWPSPLPLFSAVHPRAGDGFASRIAEMIGDLEVQARSSTYNSSSIAHAAASIRDHHQNAAERNLEEQFDDAAGDTPHGDNSGVSAGGAGGAASPAALLRQQQQQARLVTVALPPGQVLLRTKSVRADTIRALAANCQLEAELETALRSLRLPSTTAQLQQQQQTRQVAMLRSGAAAIDSNSTNNTSDSAQDAATAKFVDLDALFRRVSASIDAFAAEVVETRKAASRSQQQRGPTPSSVVAASNAFTPLQHRMLLPPMSVLQQQQQMTRETPQAGALSPSASFNAPSLSANALMASGTFNLSATNNNLLSNTTAAAASPAPASPSHNHGSNRTEKKAHDIIERERRQHAIETADYEARVDELSKRVDSLEAEARRLKETHRRELEQAKKSGDGGQVQDRLRQAAEEAAELRDAAAGLRKSRQEESQRAQGIIAELERTVARQAETIGERELDCARLERGVLTLVELYYDGAKEVAESQARAEAAAKLQLLYETTYPPALLARNHALQEKGFQLQCQIDERERTLGAVQQRLRDAKDQLQVLAADDASFVSRLKLSDEWRALTLAADEETAAAVKRIVAMFAERAAKLKQQEDAQAHRLKTLEERLAEEVVARRKRSMQDLPGSDEAERAQSSYKEQAAGIEDAIKKAVSARVMRIGLVASTAQHGLQHHQKPAAGAGAAAGAAATGGANNANTPASVSSRVLSRFLDAKKDIAAKEIRKILMADLQ